LGQLQAIQQLTIKYCNGIASLPAEVQGLQNRLASA